MNFKFYLDTTEIPEPIGWDEFELSLKRDETYHGMQFEASTGTLQFYGDAATYLKNKKDTEGLRANVTFTAQEQCDTEFIQQISGRLNFGKYKDVCGNTCTVSVPVEEDSCRVVFKNNFDKKVDVDSLLSLNKSTSLPDYIQLGQEITLPAKALKVAVEGFVEDSGYTFNALFGDSGVDHTIIRPSYLKKVDESIKTGALDPVFNYTSTVGTQAGINMTPQLLLEETVGCFSGTFNYEFIFHGDFTNFKPNGNLFNTLSVKLKIVKWDGTGDIFTNGTVVDQFDTGQSSGGFVNSFSGTFNHTFTGTTTINDGEGFYGYIDFETDQSAIGAPINWTVNFYNDTYVNVNAQKLCPDTQCEYYLIHETLSRVCESITDNCIRVKSPYYGRIDSQPFAFDADGCGSLRMLTSGLKIRRAANGTDKFFTSMKDLLQGLRAIDNIGFSIEPDTTFPEGRFILNIDEVSAFYKDDVIHTINAIADGESEVQEDMHYSKINIGYKTWQVENVNGLDEYNSTREYVTDISTISNTLDLISNLVAGGYPIEITRQQSFAATGAEDTKFDNEVFIITLLRNAYNFTVEQGGFTNPANFYDPATAYNIRLSPLRNLMRWFKSIINTYPNLTGTGNYLYFSAGTGNLEAECLIPDACAMEVNTVIEENGDLRTTNFKNIIDYTPLWKNEMFFAEYPLSLYDFNKIKSNPYGVINYECGNTGIFEKGFVKEIKYKPSKGIANFSLIKKWQ